MPAQVELFDRVSTPVDEVYVETSFIYDLILFAEKHRDPRFNSSKQFYDRMLSNRTRMWTSILTLQEIIWKIIRYNLIEEKKNLGQAYENLNLSKFKLTYPTHYSSIVRNLSPKIGQILRTFYALGFQLRIPSRFRLPMHSKADRIIRYMKAILLKYEFLEPADALHIAYARCEGTEYIVSNDKYYQDVDTIHIYSYFRK